MNLDLGKQREAKAGMIWSVQRKNMKRRCETY
jgi:hypothetical protein